MPGIPRCYYTNDFETDLMSAFLDLWANEWHDGRPFSRKTVLNYKWYRTN